MSTYNIYFNSNNEVNSIETETIDSVKIVSVLNGQKDKAGGVAGINNNGYIDPQFLQITVSGQFLGLISPSDDAPISGTTGWYWATEQGTYTNHGGFVLAPPNNFAIITVNDGNFDGRGIQLDLGGVLLTENTNQLPLGINHFKPSLVQNDKYIASNGVISTLAGRKLMVHPVSENKTYTVSGIKPNSSKYLTFHDSSGTKLGTHYQINVTALVVTAPAGAVEVRYTIKWESEPDDSGWANAQFEEGSVKTEYEAFQGYSISEVENLPLKATSLVKENRVPDPDDDHNAINKGYFDLNSVRTQDLTLEPSNNLFNPTLIVEDAYVNSAGTITNAVGWKYIDIPVNELTDYTIGRIFSTGTVYWSIWDASDVKLTNGGFASGATQVVTVPSNGAKLKVLIKRDVDDDSVYNEGTVNDGETLLTPYEAWSFELVTHIKGYPLKSSEGGGGEAYDQSLNTTDAVQFVAITAQAATFDLPEGAGSPPLGVEIGDLWVDTNDSIIKVRLV
ncbi:hypothetical protein [Echinicola shivajiensis]|uniref:hypothetical protein n=1 Tax=Echinicola shivajiensis TaxID=1035916 RepID=UPI001BFCAC17|nr:hypothetical protein [Echinicola shivajiensis]